MVKYLAQGQSIRCKPAARKSLFPVHYPNQQSMLQPMIYDWSKVQSFPQFVVSAACKMPLSVLFWWKGALVARLKFTIQMRSLCIFQIHVFFNSKNTIGFHFTRGKSGFSSYYRACVKHGTREKTVLHLYFAVSSFHEGAPAISSWVVSTNYLDFNLE